jgi:hypothetical protein
VSQLLSVIDATAAVDPHTLGSAGLVETLESSTRRGTASTR